jgi:hypothetical protein
MSKVAPLYTPDNFPAVDGTNVTSLDKGFLEAKVVAPRLCPSGRAQRPGSLLACARALLTI